MRIHSLSSNPNQPCYVMRFKGVNLMLDCGLDPKVTQNFVPIPLVHSAKLAQLPKFVSRESPSIDGVFRESPAGGQLLVDAQPEFRIPQLGVVDFGDLDAILISNYTTMLALPYITEETNFSGPIFVTEPTLNFGRLLMEECIEHISGSSHSSTSNAPWKDVVHLLPETAAEHFKSCKTWRKIYTKSKMESAMSKVTLVGFSERKDVFGKVFVSPVSSGYCIGSSNWVITGSESEKIGYIGGSSTLTTHPRPMDQTPLRNANCLIISSLTQTPTANPDSMIGEFCKTVIETTKQGGNVLVPCYPSGTVYDLIECLATHMDLNGLTNVPMFFVSPVADSSLAYANIMAEWLSSAKQARVYLPEEPFPHGNLVKSARLKSFSNLYDESFSTEYRQPCVMFCGHPSLRFGDVLHFIDLWGNSAMNTIVFTEPSFPYLEALAPFQPLLMKAAYCPIDTKLNFTQAKKLIRELKPDKIALPKVYTQPPNSVPHRTDLTIEAIPGISQYTLEPCKSVKVPITSNYESIDIDPSLAKSLNLTEVKPGVSIAPISGTLHVLNNKYTLKEIKSTDKKKVSLKRGASPLTQSDVFYGKIQVSELLQKLSSNGFHNPRVDDMSQGQTIVQLDNENALIQLADDETHLVCEEIDNTVRERVKSSIHECLNKI